MQCDSGVVQKILHQTDKPTSHIQSANYKKGGYPAWKSRLCLGHLYELRFLALEQLYASVRRSPSLEGDKRPAHYFLQKPTPRLRGVTFLRADD